MKVEAIKKLISIPCFLKMIGREPVRRSGDYLHYHSPFREDKKPSFWVDTKKDKCGDFADGGCIGDVINLAERWYHCDAKTAIANLETCCRVGSFSFAKPTIPKETERNINIKHIQPLQSTALLQYLATRGISSETAKRQLQEVYYTTYTGATAKQYFAVAFRNDKGGYELRNKYFKGSTPPKAPTTIQNHSDTVLLFEGFIDYLSCIEYWRSTNHTIPYDIIVLNSIVFINTIDLHKYDKIKMLLDTDTAGRKAANTIFMQYPNKVIDLTDKLIPSDCKDFNDFWIKTRK